MKILAERAQLSTSELQTRQDRAHTVEARVDYCVFEQLGVALAAHDEDWGKTFAGVAGAFVDVRGVNDKECRPTSAPKPKRALRQLYVRLPFSIVHYW